MKNYIEYIHENQEGLETQTTHFATRPTPYRYKYKGEWIASQSGWTLQGGGLIRIHTQTDIDGLRGLLNEIEKEIAK